MTVVWTIPALDDLDQIQDFIAKDSPAAAFRLTSGVFQRTQDLLSASPMIGRDGRVSGTRELVIPDTPYIVVYRVVDRVEILAVVHAARDWPESF